MNYPTPIVSSDEENLILVNDQDENIGTMSKLNCHLDDGVLHRAFSVFIFNAAGDVLLQRRSDHKFLWPMYWSNACCSHPREGENAEAAAHRRLEQELGITTDLVFLYKFIYQAPFEDVGSEHELCWVWAGSAEQDQISANENEVAEWQFFSEEALNIELNRNPGNYTPWMKMEWERIKQDHAHQLSST